MARKKSGKPINKDAWMATYGDMITLVLTFFIFLYSMSSVSEEKWDRIVEAFDKDGKASQIVLQTQNREGEELAGMEGALEGLAKTENNVQSEDINDLTELYQALQSYVQSQGLEKDVNVGKGEGFVIMRFRGDLFFAADSPVLQPKGTEILDYLVQGLGSMEEQIQLVRIDGHTATNPDITDYTISSRKLSTDRATAVLEYMEGKNVIQPVKLIAVGYGKFRPIADNNTSEGRAANRRVEIYISDKNTADINIDEIYKTLAPEGGGEGTAGDN